MRKSLADIPISTKGFLANDFPGTNPFDGFPSSGTPYPPQQQQQVRGESLLTKPGSTPARSFRNFFSQMGILSCSWSRRGFWFDPTQTHWRRSMAIGGGMDDQAKEYLGFLNSTVLYLAF